MSWQSLKEHYQRFKRWQREPIQYIQGEEEHRCANCGLIYTGHYCPTCSQRAGLGRIGWHSVSRGVMDMWGLGMRSRSVLYSVWQLLLRPGYLISDYISGKRQVSFPPIKMLFIISVAYAIAFHWLFPELKALGYGLDFRDAGFTEVEAKKSLICPNLFLIGLRIISAGYKRGDSGICAVEQPLATHRDWTQSPHR